MSKPWHRDVPARVTEYLATGGLWNPEAMDHEAVRHILIDARDVIEIIARERSALETDPVLDHRFIPDGMDPGICQKCSATRASHRQETSLVPETCPKCRIYPCQCLGLNRGVNDGR